MKPGHSRSLIAAIGGAAVIGAMITGCSSGSSGSTSSSGTTSVAAGSAISAGTTSVAGKASSGSATVDAAVACENLLAIDAIPSPDSGPPPADDSSAGSAGAAPSAASAAPGSGAESSAEPATDPAANKAFGEAVQPLLASALAAAPADLAVHLTALQPYLAAAIADGTAFPQEDPTFFGGIVGYEAWAHENCDYQNVDLMGVDYKFEGAPTTLKAGPTSFALMNHSDKGEFHVATFAKLKDGKQITLDEVIALPFEQIFEYVDLLPGAAAAPPGATGGVLVDLTPGTYFLVCPIPSDENDPTSAHMLKGMANQFVVT